ncbi:hypothetical protein D3C85_1613250 [compost metagenome]
MHMMQATRANLLAHQRISLFIFQCVIGMLLQLPVAQFHGFALWQVGAKDQASGRTEQWQHRAQLRHHRDRTHGGFDAYHGRALIAPYRQKAGFVQVIA